MKVLLSVSKIVLSFIAGFLFVLCHGPLAEARDPNWTAGFAHTTPDPTVQQNFDIQNCQDLTAVVGHQRAMANMVATAKSIDDAKLAAVKVYSDYQDLLDISDVKRLSGIALKLDQDLEALDEATSTSNPYVRAYVPGLGPIISGVRQIGVLDVTKNKAFITTTQMSLQQLELYLGHSLKRLAVNNPDLMRCVRLDPTYAGEMALDGAAESGDSARLTQDQVANYLNLLMTAE